MVKNKKILDAESRDSISVQSEGLFCCQMTPLSIAVTIFTLLFFAANLYFSSRWKILKLLTPVEFLCCGRETRQLAGVGRSTFTWRLCFSEHNLARAASGPHKGQIQRASPGIYRWRRLSSASVWRSFLPPNSVKETREELSVCSSFVGGGPRCLEKQTFHGGASPTWRLRSPSREKKRSHRRCLSKMLSSLLSEGWRDKGMGRGRGAAGSFILRFVVQSRVKGQVHLSIICLFWLFFYDLFFLLCKVLFHFLMYEVLVLLCFC